MLVFASSNLSIHTSSLSGKPPTFSFSEAPEKFGASKDFRLHPHKNSDMIKNMWRCSPVYMTFYSTDNYQLKTVN